MPNLKWLLTQGIKNFTYANDAFVIRFAHGIEEQIKKQHANLIFFLPKTDFSKCIRSEIKNVQKILNERAFFLDWNTSNLD